MFGFCSLVSISSSRLSWFMYVVGSGMYPRFRWSVCLNFSSASMASCCFVWDRELNFLFASFFFTFFGYLFQNSSNFDISFSLTLSFTFTLTLGVWVGFVWGFCEFSQSFFGLQPNFQYSPPLHQFSYLLLFASSWGLINMNIHLLGQSHPISFQYSPYWHIISNSFHLSSFDRYVDAS